MTADRKQNHIVFVYTIQNNTWEDYRLPDGSGVDIFRKLLSEKSIYLGEQPTIHFPVFVPGNGRTTVIIDSHSEFSGPKSSDSDSDKLRVAVQEFVKAKHPNLDGFVAFDQAHRYQIDFPKGW